MMIFKTRNREGGDKKWLLCLLVWSIVGSARLSPQIHPKQELGLNESFRNIPDCQGFDLQSLTLKNVSNAFERKKLIIEIMGESKIGKLATTMKNEILSRKERVLVSEVQQKEQKLPKRKKLSPKKRTFYREWNGEKIESKLRKCFKKVLGELQKEGNWPSFRLGASVNFQQNRRFENSGKGTWVVESPIDAFEEPKSLSKGLFSSRKWFSRMSKNERIGRQGGGNLVIKAVFLYDPDHNASEKVEKRFLEQDETSPCNPEICKTCSTARQGSGSIDAPKCQECHQSFQLINLSPTSTTCAKIVSLSLNPLTMEQGYDQRLYMELKISQKSKTENTNQEAKNELIPDELYQKMLENFPKLFTISLKTDGPTPFFDFLVFGDGVYQASQNQSEVSQTTQNSSEEASSTQSQASKTRSIFIVLKIAKPQNSIKKPKNSTFQVSVTQKERTGQPIELKSSSNTQNYYTLKTDQNTQNQPPLITNFTISDPRTTYSTSRWITTPSKYLGFITKVVIEIAQIESLVAYALSYEYTFYAAKTSHYLRLLSRLRYLNFPRKGLNTLNGLFQSYSTEVLESEVSGYSGTQEYELEGYRGRLTEYRVPVYFTRYILAKIFCYFVLSTFILAFTIWIQWYFRTYKKPQKILLFGCRLTKRAQMGLFYAIYPDYLFYALRVWTGSRWLLNGSAIVIWLFLCRLASFVVILRLGWDLATHCCYSLWTTQDPSRNEKGEYSLDRVAASPQEFVLVERQARIKKTSENVDLQKTLKKIRYSGDVILYSRSELKNEAEPLKSWSVRFSSSILILKIFVFNTALIGLQEFPGLLLGLFCALELAYLVFLFRLNDRFQFFKRRGIYLWKVCGSLIFLVLLIELLVLYCLVTFSERNQQNFDFLEQVVLYTFYFANWVEYVFSITNGVSFAQELLRLIRLKARIAKIGFQIKQYLVYLMVYKEPEEDSGARFQRARRARRTILDKLGFGSSSSSRFTFTGESSSGRFSRSRVMPYEASGPSSRPKRRLEFGEGVLYSKKGDGKGVILKKKDPLKKVNSLSIGKRRSKEAKSGFRNGKNHSKSDDNLVLRKNKKIARNEILQGYERRKRTGEGVYGESELYDYNSDGFGAFGRVEQNNENKLQIRGRGTQMGKYQSRIPLNKLESIVEVSGSEMEDHPQSRISPTFQVTRGNSKDIFVEEMAVGDFGDKPQADISEDEQSVDNLGYTKQRINLAGGSRPNKNKTNKSNNKLEIRQRLPGYGIDADEENSQAKSSEDDEDSPKRRDVEVSESGSDESGYEEEKEPNKREEIYGQEESEAGQSMTKEGYRIKQNLVAGFNAPGRLEQALMESESEEVSSNQSNSEDFFEGTLRVVNPGISESGSVRFDRRGAPKGVGMVSTRSEQPRKQSGWAEDETPKLGMEGLTSVNLAGKGKVGGVIGMIKNLPGFIEGSESPEINKNSEIGGKEVSTKNPKDGHHQGEESIQANKVDHNNHQPPGKHPNKGAILPKMGKTAENRIQLPGKRRSSDTGDGDTGSGDGDQRTRPTQQQLEQVDPESEQSQKQVQGTKESTEGDKESQDDQGEPKEAENDQNNQKMAISNNQSNPKIVDQEAPERMEDESNRQQTHVQVPRIMIDIPESLASSQNIFSSSTQKITKNQSEIILAETDNMNKLLSPFTSTKELNPGPKIQKDLENLYLEKSQSSPNFEKNEPQNGTKARFNRFKSNARMVVNPINDIKPTKPEYSETLEKTQKKPKNQFLGPEETIRGTQDQPSQLKSGRSGEGSQTDYLKRWVMALRAYKQEDKQKQQKIKEMEEVEGRARSRKRGEYVADFEALGTTLGGGGGGFRARKSKRRRKSPDPLRNTVY